jgi:hypothetical protein
MRVRGGARLENRPRLLVELARPKRVTRPKAEGLAQIEAEMQSLERDILLLQNRSLSDH